MVASTNTWGTQTVVRRYRVNGYTVLVIADNVGSGTMTSRIPLVTVSGAYLEEIVWYDETPTVNRRGRHVGVWSPFSAEALFPFLVPKPYHVHRHQVESMLIRLTHPLPMVSI